MKLIFHVDPGHGWLQVPVALLKALNIESQITKYSFYDNSGNAYLEEDCDAETFMNAYNKAGLAKIELEERHHNDFPGRRFKRFAV